MSEEIDVTAIRRFFSFLYRIEWKVAVKTGLAAALSFFLGSGFSSFIGSPETFISGLWTVQAAIVVQQTHLGSTYKSAWMRFLGVLIGCFVGAVFTSLMGSTPLSLGVGVAMTIIFCAMLSIKESIRIATLSTSIVIVLWGLHTESNPWLLAFLRFIESCFGIIIAMFVAHTLWPSGVEQKLRQHMANILQDISQLFLKATIDNTLNETQLQEVRTTSREIRDQIWKIRQLLEDSRLELLNLHSGLEEWKLLILHVERIFEYTRSLSVINKQRLLSIGEEAVYQSYKLMVAECERTMIAIALGLRAGNIVDNFDILNKASKQLEASLIDFRHQKGTRPYNFDDVEEFYVFFHTIRVIGQELIKSTNHISTILSE